jgi:hypothetical protein
MLSKNREVAVKQTFRFRLKRNGTLVLMFSPPSQSNFPTNGALTVALAQRSKSSSACFFMVLGGFGDPRGTGHVNREFVTSQSHPISPQG